MTGIQNLNEDHKRFEKAIFCENHKAVFETQELDDGCCPWCGQEVQKE